MPRAIGRAPRSSLLGMTFSMPWCCIAPGVLFLLGIGSVGIARVVAGRLMPVVLLVALVFLGRAHYLLYVKHEGNRFSVVTTWISTALFLDVSVLRFSFW